MVIGFSFPICPAGMVRVKRVPWAVTPAMVCVPRSSSCRFPLAISCCAREQQEIANGNLQEEDLGTQTIAGVTAQGTRLTRTIPAGQIGNEKPITIVHERWYSNNLQTVVMSKRSDPWSGETTYTLTNINRTEPDASLFTVPSDYTVTQGHPGIRGMGRNQAPPPGED